MGFSFTNNRGFRDQQLSTTPRARSRLYNAQAAVLEAGLRKPVNAMIGGQMVDQNDNAAMNAAGGMRDAAQAESDAQLRMRQQFGSTTVTRGTPGGLEGNGPQTLAGQGQPGPGMNGDAVYPGGPSFNSLMDPNLAGADPQVGAPNTNFQGGQYNIIQKPQQDFGVGEPRAPLRSTARSLPSTTLGDEFNTEEGFRNGGAVGTKQRSVKQPGYQSGGKVRMPPAYEEAAAAGYGEGPDAVDRMMWDRNAPAREAAEQEMLQTRDIGFATGQAESIPGYKWGDTPPNAPGAPSAPAPARDGYRWDDNQGMRGMMAGGQIGNEMEDDGKDTVDVRVREGEYLLNPPTVANGFGNGDYDAGVENLNQIVKGSTGEEPGPTPVNEEGEALRAGFAPGGAVQLDMFGEPIRRFAGQAPSPEALATQQPGGMGTTTTARPIEGPARPSSARMATRNVGNRVGNATRGFRNFAASDVNTKPLRTLGRGAKTVAAGLQKIPGGRLMHPAVALAAGAGNMVGDAAYEAGIETGADWVDTVGGTVNNMGVLTGLWGDPEYDFQVAEGNRIANEFSTPAAATPAGTADAGAETPAAPYGRAFGGGPVDLRDMDVVQNTGGPDGERIIREDINGVPTFTNVRRGGFRGDTATLQAEADARAAQDVGIRAQQAQVVDQMRQNAPSYDQAGVDQRRAESLAMQQTAMEANSRRPSKATGISEQLRQQFQIPQRDDEGNITGFIDDEPRIAVALDAAAQLGIDLDALPDVEKQNFVRELNRVYDETLRLVNIGDQRGMAVKDVPRTQRDNNVPFYQPDSNIGWGDVSLFGKKGPTEFGLRDYARGIFSDDPEDDGYVIDPESGLRVSAYDMIRDRRGNVDPELVKRYGLPTQPEG